MWKARELQSQSVEELQILFHETCAAIFRLKNEWHISKKGEKPHLLGEKKRERARLLTVLRQKQKEQGEK